MNFDSVERIADAILYEGSLLFPLRASSLKNQIRWQFGVIAPRSPREDGEPWFSQTECLIEPTATCRLHVRVRFLRPHHKRSGLPLSATPCAVDVVPIDLSLRPATVDWSIAQYGPNARFTIRATPLDRHIRVQARLENLEPWQTTFEGDRDALLCASLVSAHLVLGVEGGAFISLLDPPPASLAPASRCVNVGSWPVLAGDPARHDLMLSSPIILQDYPAFAAGIRAM